MSAQPKVVPVEDPAGLDKLLLAAGKGCSRFLEGLAERKLGTRVELWDGKNGLGPVLEEFLKSAGVPNKRLPDLFTPRLVLHQAGVFTPIVNPFAAKTRPHRRLRARV